MKRTAIINLLIIYSITVTAQDTVIYSFKGHAEIMKIRNQAFYISRVTDARPLTSSKHIGFVSNVFFKQKEALLDEDAAIAINNHLQFSLPRGKQSDSILLKINQLVISEKSNDGQDKTVLAANFDFIRHTPKGYFLVDNQNVFFYKNAFWTGHISNIINGLEMAIRQFQRGKRWALPTDSLQVIDEAALTQIEKAAILTDTTLQKGVYTSFYSFRKNSISMPYKWILNDANVESLGIPNEDGEYRPVEPDDMIWGFCDGEKSYIYHNNYYLPLIFKEGKAFFNGFSRERRDKNMATVGIIFGLAGVLAASTTSEDAALYELNMDTGEIKMIELIHKK